MFLQHLSCVGAERHLRQAVVAGLAPQDNPSDLGLPGDTAVYPVRFEGSPSFPVVGMSDVMPYPSTRWRDLTPTMLDQWREAFAAALQDALDNFRPDAIVSHHLWLLSGLVRTLAPGVPSVTLCHGTGLRQLDLAPQLAPLAIDGCADLPRVFALTGAQQQTIIHRHRIPAGNITVSGGAYDQRVFHTNGRRNPGDVLRVVYAGKLSFAKGLLPLLDAWDALPASLGPRELTLAGSAAGGEADAIRIRASRCVQPVHLPGAMPQAELADLFRSCDVFVLPSYYEGLPLVLVEALACGLRAVCTDLPGVCDWCGPAINDRVSWVEPPVMRTVDEPVDDALPAFVARLGDALCGQMRQARTGALFDEARLHDFLRPRTWEGLFERIERML